MTKKDCLCSKHKTVLLWALCYSHTISYHIISYHIISYHIISHHITSHHITSHHITSYHIISYHIISYHITIHHITSHITSHHIIIFSQSISLQWHHNEHDDGPNHGRLCCLLNRLFRHRSKKTSKLRVTGLCEGNPLMTPRGFPSQRSINTENVLIWWRHHDSVGTHL